VYDNKCTAWTLFSGEDEQKFLGYVTRAGNMHYGLSRKEDMELAHELARQTSKDYLKLWGINEHAGEQTFIDFMKCNNKVVSLQ
jgi:hypothetical protein